MILSVSLVMYLYTYLYSMYIYLHIYIFIHLPQMSFPDAPGFFSVSPGLSVAASRLSLLSALAAGGTAAADAPVPQRAGAARVMPQDVIKTMINQINMNASSPKSPCLQVL